MFILERILGPNFTTLLDANSAPSCPFSVPPPQRMGASSGSTNDTELLQGEHTDDLGINAYCMKSLSVWGQICSYLHSVKMGWTEDAWRQGSRYSNLVDSLYECDASLCQRHLLRHSAFVCKSTAEVAAESQYWRPWILMQVLVHASSAVLNHPFIHMVALRDTGREMKPSRQFLQQTVDLALFHSGWVFRLLRSFESIALEICDPLLAQCVAATASISWLFQFAGDPEMARKAREDLQVCTRLLQAVSTRWPHLTEKVRVVSMELLVECLCGVSLTTSTAGNIPTTRGRCEQSPTRLR